MYTSTQQADDMWDDYFAKSDAVSERYACQIQDARLEASIEQEHHDYMCKVWDAGFGTDQDAYEAYLRRLEEYSTRTYL